MTAHASTTLFLSFGTPVRVRGECSVRRGVPRHGRPGAVRSEAKALK